LMSIDSIFHDSCTFHVYKLMRGSQKNSQSAKLPKPIVIQKLRGLKEKL
jgi:hypothetical protein